jgi:phosphomannomutase
MEEFGQHEVRRVDLHVSEKEKAVLMKKYAKGVREIGGYAVIDRKDTDGYKFFVDRGWVLVRASGTEPLIRFYAEAESVPKVEALLEAATRF